MTISARGRLIVALDTRTAADALSLVTRLAESVRFYKVGLELVMNGGIDLVRTLKRQGKSVFLDMKLLDIENTVERATANAAALGVTFLTVHGHDLKTLRAAVAGRGQSPTKLLAVTVLTNLTRADLSEQKIEMEPADLVVHRARLAREAGCDGIVASGLESSCIRAAVGSALFIVTPGIRLAGGAADDQTRTVSPHDAITGGADYLVVGRPITQATDPRSVADAIVDQIEGAQRGRA